MRTFHKYTVGLQRQGDPSSYIDFRISDFVVTEEKHLHVLKNTIKNNANYLGLAKAFKTVKYF